MALPTFVPEEAPFSAEQREWLNSFFGKLFPTGVPENIPTRSTGPALPVTILFGSQTGNTESLAKKLAKALKKGPFEPTIHDLGDYPCDQLAQEKYVLVLTSTYGDGEPPDNAAEFHSWLHSDQAPRLESLHYSVLALGDTEYPDFCKCGIEFDQQFALLGATQLFERVDCDVDYDDSFARWRDGVTTALKAFAPASQVDFASLSQEAEPEGYSKSNPFPAKIHQHYNLARKGSPKETYHIEFSLEGSGLTYEAGDALGVMPQNDPHLVDEILQNLPFNTEELVPMPNGEEDLLRNALIQAYDIRTVNEAFLRKWQERCGHPYLKALVQGGSKSDFEAFCWGRELIDLILDYPADFSDAEEFVSILRKLNPRLYSIASSPKAHDGEVHLTVGAVRYSTYGRQRGGVCSTYLADRAPSLLSGVYVHENKAFRPPSDPTVPMIMVGPGTGIAPFRAFLEERQATNAKGSNWLFFGNPYRESDFFYEKELSEWVDQGFLKLSLAFSRDQEKKIYVQHRMIEQGAELWSWIEAGAHFYVCGDASRMAKDVDFALHQVIREQGNMTEQEAEAYVKQMKKDKRYARDVY